MKHRRPSTRKRLRDELNSRVDALRRLAERVDAWAVDGSIEDQGQDDEWPSRFLFLRSRSPFSRAMPEPPVLSDSEPSSPPSLPPMNGSSSAENTLERLIHRVQGSPLVVDLPLHVLRKACEELAADHRRGLVHGRLSPQSIEVQGDGSVVVAGSCRARCSGSDAGGAAADAAIDDVADAAIDADSNAAFMAPEQFRGEGVTPGTDVYALGAILFRVLTGITPLEAVRRDTGVATLDPLAAAVDCSLPPPSSLSPPDRKLPRDRAEELDRIVGRCLEKEPEARYADVEELLDELDGV